jgi:putative SOS response-associated peptidase YedK
MVPPGTAGEPHAPGVGKHFQAQMYNTNTDMCTRLSNALAPAFRRHLSRGRTCVVPLDGIYEWTADPTVPDSQARKVPAQPYYAHRPDGSPLLAAGLYSLIPTGVPGEPPALHFSLLTSPAGPPFADLAARSPVLLTCPADVRAWLSPDPPPSFIHGLCGASRAACGGGGALSLRWHPVSKDINKVGNVVENPHLEVPLAAAPSVEGFLTSGGGGDAFKSSAASPAKKEGAAKRGGIGTFFPKAEPSKKKARAAPSPPAVKKAAANFFKASPAMRPPPAAAAWACAGCTFLNAAGVGECEMCGGAPP